MPKYFTPPDKTLQRPISPFNNMTPNLKYSHTASPNMNARNGDLYNGINLDPQDKCVVEGCMARRMITPNGEKLVVCSAECDRKLRGLYNPFY